MQNNSKHFVFVYGTLRDGFRFHYYLKGSKFIGEAKTKEKYKLTYKEFPCVTKEQVCNIVGEVYEVDDKKLKELDYVESHPRLYKREIVPVVLNDGTELEAWLYFYNLSTKNFILIKSGDYKEFILRRNQEE